PTVASNRRTMSNTNVETVNRGPDRVKLGLAIVVLAAGIVGYSLLETQPGIVRVGVFLASVIAAAFIAWTSETGKRAVGYLKDSSEMTGIGFALLAVKSVLLYVIVRGQE